MKRAFFVLVLLTLAAPSFAQAPVTYRISFPAPEHRWLQVEAVFSDVGAAPLQLRMSRTSPGRYALHEFAKNVYDVTIVDGAGRLVTVVRPNPHQWDVTGHDGTVRATYKVFGDRADGTYLGVDSTHAHINMPATLMWARGLDERPVEIRFEPPPGSGWQVATQLHTGADAFTFKAPNLQYLMDSPAELSRFVTRTFTIAPRNGAAAPATFRIALHHNGTDAEADRLAADVQKIVEQEGRIFGEFPVYEVGQYTFLLDLLPYASGDGMEHRNSTSISIAGALGNPDERGFALSAIAHELFHCWNVERIRPRSLEPFNFEEANMSGELWLAEGVTNYFGPLAQARAGVTSVEATTEEFAGTINAVTLSPGRLLRTAEEMSRLAPFVDAARSVDRTDWDNTFISYYTWGEAIGLGLDLTLRDRSDGRVTLDDYMRAMWTKYGKPGGREGYVDRPYTAADARDTLAEVAGDRAFADDFFARYIQGHELVDYGRLLARAGLILRSANPDRASIGRVRFEFVDDRARVTAAVPLGSPAYKAGLEQDDRLISLDGEAMSSHDKLEAFLERHKAGTTVTATFERRGATVSHPLTLERDPVQEIVALESTGATLSPSQQAFRAAWLGAKN